jgi:mannose-1-phosphate guanylyltransferase
MGNLCCEARMALYAVVMAGGRGERFWPLSTSRIPKPFIPLLGAATLIQRTVSRLQPLIQPERIYISIGKAQSEIAREQLPEIPEENFIVEPVGRDTSACLGFCALHLEHDPDAVMLALPADHFIPDDAAYRRTIQTGIENLPGATAVVFGIVPTRPETGYGYVRARKPAGAARAWDVLQFVEKPDAQRAEQYVQAGDYFWNGGIFLWRVGTLLDLFRAYLPDTYEGLNRLRPLIRMPDSGPDILSIFSELQRISIDFGILEKVPGLRLVPAAFTWDDIGNWAALDRVLPHDGCGNIATGPHASVETEGCILHSDAGTIAAFGVTDLIVIQANGKVLVCPKNRAGELKKLLAAMGPEGQ